MSQPDFTPAEARTRATFHALLNALSYPGRVQHLPLRGDAPVHEGCTVIAETLLDLETTFFTPDETLTEPLSLTTARPAAPSQAAYHFYPALTDALLDTVKTATVGDMLFPDTGASIVIGCALGRGQSLLLTGPGIQTEQVLQVDGIAPAFWDIRQRTTRYPLGWDVYLIDGNRVAGLPRTTTIKVEGRTA